MSGRAVVRGDEPSADGGSIDSSDENGAAESPPPLHRVIDALIEASWQESGVTPAAMSSDAEFLRRTYLDLTGTIPTADQARAFLDDTRPEKRRELIQRLLGSDEYARQMQRVLDVMLMERRPDKHIPRADWQEYLRRWMAENKPWDQLVREILAADGTEESTRPAAKFFLDREGETNLLVRDTGRLFLGMDLQCAQCHNHPIVLDYAQDDYYGLYAFLSRSSVFTDKDKKVTIAEKAPAQVTYKSVFEPDVEHQARPHLPGMEEIEEPTFEEGQAYEVAPAEGVRPVPQFSRRAQLARSLPTAETPTFAANIVNRLWGMLMGRALVEPVAFIHADNPPSHPKVLDRLCAWFVESGYDIKALLEQLTLSRTYQRSSVPPDDQDVPPPESFAVGPLKPLSPEQLAWSMMQATGVTDVARAQLGEERNEQKLYDKLKGNVGSFVSSFAAPAGEPQTEFRVTLAQALFLSNSGVVMSWLEPQAGNLVDRLSKLADADAVAEELYLSVLTRRPTSQERSEVAALLEEAGDQRIVALQELAWALATSAEFRFNH
ncbi:MAG: DUF1549 domain-containing protein [Pirellulales bacterium]